LEGLHDLLFRLSVKLLYLQIIEIINRGGPPTQHIRNV